MRSDFKDKPVSVPAKRFPHDEACREPKELCLHDRHEKVHKAMAPTFGAGATRC